VDFTNAEPPIGPALVETRRKSIEENALDVKNLDAQVAPSLLEAAELHVWVRLAEGPGRGGADTTLPNPASGRP